MEDQTFVISRQEFEEYERLKRMQQVDKELLTDIATGIKDILQGNVREV